MLGRSVVSGEQGPSAPALAPCFAPVLLPGQHTGQVVVCARLRVMSWYPDLFSAPLLERNGATPLAVAADRNDDGHIIELRIYWSMWPLTGEHHHRPPLLASDPSLGEPDVVGDYQRALATGDAEAAVATFEPDAYVGEPAGGEYVH